MGGAKRNPSPPSLRWVTRRQAPLHPSYACHAVQDGGPWRPHARLAQMRASPPVLIAGLLALACTGGCGLKGPLYLPTAEQQRETAKREAALAERERTERNAKTAPAIKPAPAPTQPPAQTTPASAPAN